MIAWVHCFLHLSFIFLSASSCEMHDYGSDAETTKQSDDKTCLLLEKFLHGVIAWDALPMLIPTLMRKKKILKKPNTSETRPRYRLSRNQSHRRVSNYRDHLIILTFHWCGGRNSLEAHLRHSKYLNNIQKWKLQRLSERGPSGCKDRQIWQLCLYPYIT